MSAYLNRIGTAVPAHEAHAAFVEAAKTRLNGDKRSKLIFERLAERSQIARRYSVLPLVPRGDPGDPAGEGVEGARLSTGARMDAFERFAPALATRAVAGLDLGRETSRVTHLVVVSCTGFYAPGLDVDLVERCRLPRSVERTQIGFMGCHGALAGLRFARHVVLSEPAARVLLVDLELCTLHLKEAHDLPALLSYLVFGDGCAAALVTREEVGLRIDRFGSTLLQGTRDLLTWHVGDGGFDITLSGRVPGIIHRALEQGEEAALAGADPRAVDAWAVHPGGRAILDAVESGLRLPPDALARSRRVLSDYGNMSSASVLFVLQALLAAPPRGARGCALAYGPGITAETMLFRCV